MTRYDIEIVDDGYGFPYKEAVESKSGTWCEYDEAENLLTDKDKEINKLKELLSVCKYDFHQYNIKMMERINNLETKLLK